MKKLFFILLLLPLFSTAQIDSSAIKVSISVQARDIEVISTLIVRNDLYEDVWDNVKVKFRVAVPPAGNEIVVMDTIPLKLLHSIYILLSSNNIAVKKNVLSRYEAILRAKNQSWLTGET